MHQRVGKDTEYTASCQGIDTQPLEVPIHLYLEKFHQEHHEQQKQRNDCC